MVSDHAGDNATTKMMDSIFGGLKGQPRDDLGRFARRAVNAPSSTPSPSLLGGQKRPLESGETTETQEESKRPALEAASTALDKTLDNDTPVSVDPETFRQYNAQEIELKQAMERIQALEEEKARWDDLGRATGTHDIEGAKRIVERATDEYAQGEIGKIQTAIKYLEGLAGRIEAPEWKAHVENTGKQMQEIAGDKETILSENYSKNAQPIVSAVVAASYDIQRQVGEAKSDAADWKNKYEEERAQRMRLEEHLNVLERGTRSATSSWSVHASHDAAPKASTMGGFGLPASSSRGVSASSSLFSKPASSMGSATYTTKNIFTAASSASPISASSGGSAATPVASSSVSGGGPLPSTGKQVHFEEGAGGSAMIRQETVHHTAMEFSNPMDAIGSSIHPHFAEAMQLTKNRRAHQYGDTRSTSATPGKLQKENAKQLRAASVLPEDISDWGRVFGRTQIRQPSYGNMVFT
jgi:hypothetical protein